MTPSALDTGRRWFVTVKERITLRNAPGQCARQAQELAQDRLAVPSKHIVHIGNTFSVQGETQRKRFA